MPRILNIPPRVQPGKPVSASEYNALLAALETLAGMSVEPPLELSLSTAGLRLRIGGRLRVSLGVVMQVSGPPTHGPSSSYTYDVRCRTNCIGNLVGMKNLMPASRTADVEHARIGDPCVIVDWDTESDGAASYVRHLICYEPVYFEPCGGGGSGTSGGTDDQLVPVQ